MCPWRDPEGVLFSRAAPTAGAGRRVSLEFLLLYMELPSVATGKRRQQPHICPKPMAARPNVQDAGANPPQQNPTPNTFCPTGRGCLPACVPSFTISPNPPMTTPHRAGFGLTASQQGAAQAVPGTRPRRKPQNGAPQPDAGISPRPVNFYNSAVRNMNKQRLYQALPIRRNVDN